MSDPKIAGHTSPDMLCHYNPKITVAEIPDDALDAWLEAVPPPNPRVEFTRELSELIDRYREQVDTPEIVATLGLVARALRAP